MEPAHTVPVGLEIMEIPIGMGLTSIVMEFDVAGFPVPQLRFEVRTQLITFPFNGT
jgi:hypothetical protein